MAINGLKAKYVININQNHRRLHRILRRLEKQIFGEQLVHIYPVPNIYIYPATTTKLRRPKFPQKNTTETRTICIHYAPLYVYTLFTTLFIYIKHHAMYIH